MVVVVTVMSRCSQRDTKPASKAPTSGASQNSQSWAIYGPPANRAGPVLRAGLTEVLVTGIEIRWMSVRHRPIGMPAKPDRRALRRAADDDEQEEEGQQHFRQRSRRPGCICRGEIAVAVRGEAVQLEAGLAGGDHVEDRRRDDGADHLRDDVGHDIGGLELFRRPKARPSPPD